MIIGYYGFGNAGDEWLLKKTLHHLKKKHPTDHHYYLCGPSPSINNETTIPVYRTQFKTILKTIKQSHIVVVGGGGVFQDNTSVKSLVYYCALLRLAYYFKKPILMLGQGFSPLRHSLSKKILKWTLNKPSIQIEVRDQDSYDYLKEIGVTRCQLSLGKDLAFSDQDIPKQSKAHSLSSLPDGTILGLSLRKTYPLGNLNIPKGVKIHFIKTQDQEDSFITNHWPKELPKFTQTTSLIDLINRASPIPKLDHVLTMRYHTAVWALLNGIPCSVIPVDQKLRSLAMEYNLEVIEPLPTIDFWDYPICNSSLGVVVNQLLIRSKDKTAPLSWVSTLNPELIMTAEENPLLKEHYKKAWRCLPDGIGLVWAIRHKTGKKINRICGSDILPALLKESISIYLVGATPENCELAVENIKNSYPKVTLSGHHHGYFNEHEKEKIIIDIVTKKPQFIWVGLGCPKQEAFIEELNTRADHGIAIGVGGMIDILSGKVKRAPKWVQKMHLEWAYRIIQHPTRVTRLKIVVPFLKKVLF